MRYTTHELRKKLLKRGHTPEKVEDIMARYVKAFSDKRLDPYRKLRGDKKKMVELTLLCEEIFHEQVPELYD